MANQRVIVTADCESIELSFVFLRFPSPLLLFHELELTGSEQSSKPLGSRGQVQTGVPDRALGISG